MRGEPYRVEGVGAVLRNEAGGVRALGCREDATGVAAGEQDGQARGPAPTLTLPDVVHRFKTLTTNRYSDGVKQMQWPPYAGRLWQRNYYEHIIRDEKTLSRIREYIASNAERWLRRS